MSKYTHYLIINIYKTIYLYKLFYREYKKLL